MNTVHCAQNHAKYMLSTSTWLLATRRLFISTHKKFIFSASGHVKGQTGQALENLKCCVMLNYATILNYACMGLVTVSFWEWNATAWGRRAGRRRQRERSRERGVTKGKRARRRDKSN